MRCNLRSCVLSKFPCFNETNTCKNAALFHMLHSRIFFFLLGLFVLPFRSGAADTNSAREYRDAMLAHDKAIAAATAQENKSYQGTLATLLRHAQLEGDSDTAARVQQAMANLADQLKAPVAVSAKPELVGTWKLLVNENPVVVDNMDVNSDGTALKNGIEHATWALKDNQLQITYVAGGWMDNFDLPVRNGQMAGHNKAGLPLTLFRLGTPLPRTVLTAPSSEFLGTWYLDTVEADSRHYVMQVREDGTWSFDREYRGTWTVDNGYFNIRFDDHPDFLDRYRLPIHNGELQGKNYPGAPIKLRRNATPANSSSGGSTYFGNKH